LRHPAACRDFGIHASAISRREEHTGHKVKDVNGHFREGLFFRIPVNPALVSECYIPVNMINARYHAVVEVSGRKVFRSAK